MTEVATRRAALVVAAAAALALLVGYPLYELLRTVVAEGWSDVADALGGRGGPASAIANTLVSSLAATALAVPVALAAALAVERRSTTSRRLLRLAMLAPLIVPPFVSALSWERAYGPGGLTDDLFGVTLPGLFGGTGVVLVIAVNAVPLAYLVVAAAMATRADPDLERAARASGATATRAFRDVTLPLLRPGLAAAAALVFVFAVNSFGVPAVLGLPGGFGTMTTDIYRDLAQSADPAAFLRVLVLAALLVATALVVVATGDAARRNARAPRTGAPGGAAPSPVSGGRRASTAIAGYLVVSTLIPLAALVLTALTRAVGLAPWPSNLTTGNFSTAVDSATVAAFGRSLLLAVAAATIVLALGGLAVAAGRLRRGGWFGTAVVLTFAVPGSALAVAVLLAYGSWLRDTLLLILVAYLAKFWALGHRPLAGSVEALPVDVVRAARVSGARPATALRTVVMPLLAPALAAAWLLVFLFALHELTISSLLHGPGTETLAVVILDLRQLGDVTVTAALAVLLTLVVVVAALPLLALRGRRRLPG